MKPEVKKAEENLKVLENVQKESNAAEGSAEKENLAKSIQKAKEDLDEA